MHSIQSTEAIPNLAVAPEAAQVIASPMLPAIEHLATKDIRVLVVENANAESNCNLVGLVPIQNKPIYRLPFKAAEIWKHEQCFDTTPLLHKQFATEAWQLICEQLKTDGFSLLSLDTVSGEQEVDRVFTSAEKKNGIVRFQRDHYERAAFTPADTTDDYVKNQITEFSDDMVYIDPDQFANKVDVTPFSIQPVSYTHLTLPTILLV